MNKRIKIYADVEHLISIFNVLNINNRKLSFLLNIQNLKDNSQDKFIEVFQKFKDISGGTNMVALLLLREVLDILECKSPSHNLASLEKNYKLDIREFFANKGIELDEESVNILFML